MTFVAEVPQPDPEAPPGASDALRTLAAYGAAVTLALALLVLLYVGGRALARRRDGDATRGYDRDVAQTWLVIGALIIAALSVIVLIAA